MHYLHDGFCAGLLEGLEGVGVGCTACVAALLVLVISRRLVGVLSRQRAEADLDECGNRKGVVEAATKLHKPVQQLSALGKKSESAVRRVSPSMKTHSPLADLACSLCHPVCSSMAVQSMLSPDDIGTTPDSRFY